VTAGVVLHANALRLPLAAASVDAVVTDSPYGLEFMGEDWDTFAKLVNLPAVRPAGSARIRERVDQRTNRAGGGKSVTATPEAYVAGRVYQAFCEAWAGECLRVLKPGGHLVAFGHPRTYHRLVCGVEDAGFEPRETLLWLFGQGMPKSHNVARAIDMQLCSLPGRHYETTLPAADRRPGDHLCPPTDAGDPWLGWGTGLKPAFEPITVARKPLDGTIASNVLAHGTGGLHIDAARVNVGQVVPGGGGWRGGAASRHEGWRRTVHVTNTPTAPHTGGRWPANLILSHGPGCQLRGVRQVRNPSGSIPATVPSSQTKDVYGAANQRRFVARYGGPEGMEHVEVWACEPGCPVAELDRQSGATASRKAPPRASSRPGEGWRMTHTGAEYADAGGASRFFYVAKAPRAERPRVNGVAHPSVKPRDLLRLLVRLVVPAGGVVLDPFAGSGTTLEAAALEGLHAVGCEKTAEYLPLIRHRLRRAERALRVPWQPDAPPLLAGQPTLWDSEVPA
jgi:DNA modification methylase